MYHIQQLILCDKDTKVKCDTKCSSWRYFETVYFCLKCTINTLCHRIFYTYSSNRQHHWTIDSMIQLTKFICLETRTVLNFKLILHERNPISIIMTIECKNVLTRRGKSYANLLIGCSRFILSENQLIIEFFAIVLLMAVIRHIWMIERNNSKTN